MQIAFYTLHDVRAFTIAAVVRRQVFTQRFVLAVIYRTGLLFIQHSVYVQYLLPTAAAAQARGNADDPRTMLVMRFTGVYVGQGRTLRKRSRYNKADYFWTPSPPTEVQVELRSGRGSVELRRRLTYYD